MDDEELLERYQFVNEWKDKPPDEIRCKIDELRSPADLKMWVEIDDRQYGTTPSSVIWMIAALTNLIEDINKYLSQMWRGLIGF